MTPVMQRRIWVSVTSIDLGELVDVAQRLEEAGVDGFHVDVSDGIFAPDLTFGHRVVSALTSRTSLPVEAHLMVVTPEEQLRAVSDAGASRASFHVEASRYPWRVAGLGKSLGLEVGLAINPVTPVESLHYLVPICDYVNVLTTEPDEQGERMLPAVRERLSQVAALGAGGWAVEVDGGVNLENLPPLVAAGATEIVVGRALVADPQPTRLVAALRAVGRSRHQGPVGEIG
jgi:ribulose-phosphate 3-epimerase